MGDTIRVCYAYKAKYNTTIPDDNDSGNYTREQIAARILAI